MKSSNYNPYTGKLSLKNNLIAALDLSRLFLGFANDGKTEEAMDLDSNHWKTVIDNIEAQLNQ